MLTTSSRKHQYTHATHAHAVGSTWTQSTGSAHHARNATARQPSITPRSAVSAAGRKTTSYHLTMVNHAHRQHHRQRRHQLLHGMSREHRDLLTLLQAGGATRCLATDNRVETRPSAKAHRAAPTTTYETDVGGRSQERILLHHRQLLMQLHDRRDILTGLALTYRRVSKLFEATTRTSYVRSSGSYTCGGTTPKNPR